MKYLFVAFFTLILLACNQSEDSTNTQASAEGDQSVLETQENDIIRDGEEHFASLRQLTFGGDNAEAYWSFDDSKLVFQSKSQKFGSECDQIFVMDVAGEKSEDFMHHLNKYRIGKNNLFLFPSRRHYYTLCIHP